MFFRCKTNEVHAHQAISRWENRQSTSDLENLVALSKCFGVTTDYLLMDDVETPFNNNH